MERELSIIIPARNEEFLKNTIEDILKNIEADTEILVVLDGQLPVEPLTDHDRVTLIYVPESIGQRASINLAARMSRAKYVMKLDAHCSVGPGFDRIMIADCQPDWTMVPMMYNLHIFDWVCKNGHRVYQGPTPSGCPNCGAEMTKEMLWHAKPSPETTSMRFDRDLKFQYWSGYKKHQHGDLVETMSIIGACFFMHRERFWELGGCDEEHGSWGQQGTEVACKTWLSGGKLICSRKTWFGHLFRTQGGDFGFPYKLSGNAVERARRRSKDLWLNNKWPGQKHDLQWLIDKFDPPGWDGEGPTKGIIFYTDNKLSLKIAHRVQKNLRSIVADREIPLISSSLKPMEFGERNLHFDGLERGPLTMFKQILGALEASDADVIFFCEHDVLYHPSHFSFVPQKRDRFYYNWNWWSIGKEDGLSVRWDANRVSQMCCYRDFAIAWYKEKIAEIEANGFNRSYEPGGRDEKTSEHWVSEFPNVDIRHGGTLTKSKWSADDFRDKSTGQNFESSYEVPGWGVTKEVFSEILKAV